MKLDGLAHVAVRLVSAALLSLWAIGCAESVRVPLAVPLPVVGGARPAVAQGLELITEFGDGVWGQEQERAEMLGGGVGFAAGDRAELIASGFRSTRSVRTPSGDAQHGEVTSAFRMKLRLADAGGGRLSIGVNVAIVGASRARSAVQNDRLRAFDVAMPIEVYRARPAFTDYRFGLYGGPRLVAQSFSDRIEQTQSDGTMVGGFAGGAARWRFFTVLGELNVMRTPEMRVDGSTYGGGWIALPTASARLVIPVR